MSGFGRLREPGPEEFPEWSRNRLKEVMSDPSVVNLVDAGPSYRWPFKNMSVGDEVSFYPTSTRAVWAAHAYGSSRGWKFKTFKEWPLTIVQRVK